MKSKVVIVICTVIAVLSVSLVALAVTVSAKGYERFTVKDKLDYSEVAERENMAKQKKLCLAKDGQSEYSLVYPSDGGEELYVAVGYFSQVLNRIFGSESVLVKSDAQFNVCPTKAIVIGDTVFSGGINIDEVKGDGYAVATRDDRIFIKANNIQGCLNGIYGFLEDNLGVMFIEENYDYIPSFPTVYLDSLNYVSNPDVAWRKVYQYEVLQNGWYKRLRLNGTESNGTKEGVHKGWGTWCHSAFDYVDPEIYFDTNPEYFAFIDGQRTKTQLCYSHFIHNEEAFKIIADRLDQMIAAYPDAEYWDFSIMDNNDYCRCEDCKEIKKSTGSMMGTLLPLINKLALLHPDKKISTLAYLFCSDVPKGMKCEENVNVTVAIIGTSQNYSLSVGGNVQSGKGKNMIESWGKVAPSLLVWDYVVNFSNLLMPYPNYAVQKNNLKFYLKNNATAIFHQGSREKEDEMARMRSYLLARQLWDSDVDMEKLMAKYITVAYGKAARAVAEYIDAMSDLVLLLPGNLDLYDSVRQHSTDYLATTKINEYLYTIHSGLEKVETDKLAKERLERVYMNVLYARCKDASIGADKKAESAKKFKTIADKYGVEKLSETGVSTQEWYDDYMNNEIEKLSSIRTTIITLSAVVPMLLIGFALMVVTTGLKKKRIIIQTDEQNGDDVKEEQ